MPTHIVATKDLDPSEYAPYYQNYIDQAGEGGIHELLGTQKGELLDFFDGMSSETASTVHAPYTWTITEVLAHIIDTEKIFSCRAHRIACGDDAELPGFDQDALVANYDYSQTAISELASEFEALRTTNQAFFRRLNDQAWLNRGVCDQKQISVRAIAVLLVGHSNHHLKILKQRLA